MDYPRPRTLFSMPTTGHLAIFFSRMLKVITLHSVSNRVDDFSLIFMQSSFTVGNAVLLLLHELGSADRALRFFYYLIIKLHFQDLFL